MRLRVCLLEETENWNEEITKRAGKIFGVYLYNPDTRTHCCEITPSHELYFLHSVPENLPDDEDERERLLDDMDEGNLETERVSYMHCHTLKAMPRIKRGELKTGTYQYDRYRMREFDIDEVIEHYQGNPDY